MKIGSVLSAVTAAALILPFSHVAMADDGGFYLQVGAGVNIPETADLTPAGEPTSSNYDLDAGFAATGSAGYEFGNGFRTELELGYRGSSDGELADGTANDGPGANVSTGLAMINAIYELPTGGRIRPYIGAGIGIVRTNYNGTEPLTGVLIDDADSALGLQAIIGVSIEASQAVDVFIDYRYLRSGKLNLVSNDLERVEVKNRHHAFMAGMKYRMGTQYFADGAN